jgi:hypothetical protein
MITESNLLDLTKKKFQIWENHNLDQLSQIFDDQCLMFNSHGNVITKEDLIKKIRVEECGLTEINFQNTIARIYGSSAVASGEGVFTSSKEGQTYTTKLNFLDVWIEREDGWKLVSTHYSKSA